MDTKDLKGLMEAYAEVYASQELTEEQVWEEVETWVNSLIEEGYDLSDYTWEEMYEDYINEDLIGDLRANAGNIKKGLSGAYQGAMRTASNVNQSVSDRMQRNIKSIKPTSKFADLRGSNTPGSNTPAIPKVKYPVAGTPPTKTATPVIAKEKPVITKQKPVTPTATAAPKPAPATTPAAKPAAGATTPAAKPATGMLGKTSFERRTPTSAELKAAQSARAGGEKDPEKVLQAAKAASEPKPAATPTPNFAQKASGLNLGSSQFKSTASPTPPPAATPTPVKKPVLGSQKPGNMNSSFDMFDVVKGYLIDEGYADTEEAALAIMANMSEEWKQSIVEMSPEMQNLMSRPSNRIDGKKSPAPVVGQPPTSGSAVKPVPQSSGGLTPIQRLQRRPDTTIR